jgi:hypothetical protein
MLTRAKWIAGLATLGVVGASSGAALGVGFVHVKVSVPAKPVPLDRGFPLGVKGHSSKPAELAMFVSTHPCKATAEAETVLFKEKKATRPVHHKVHGDFNKPFMYSVNSKGKHYACAYLYEVPQTTLARDEASWQVT